jgi:serine/threonine protein kinase
MSLYDGDLYQLIKGRNKEPFEFSEILTIAKSVLSALVILHSRKLIHRDVKSANVLYETEGNTRSYYLSDFGAARVLTKNRRASTFSGTTCWIAPEVFAKTAEYSFEADIWSFGMILYELMTLEIPYFDRGLGVEDYIIEGNLPTLTATLAGQNATLLTLYYNCVTLNPAERLTAAEALRCVITLTEEFL